MEYTKPISLEDIVSLIPVLILKPTLDEAMTTSVIDSLLEDDLWEILDRSLENIHFYHEVKNKLLRELRESGGIQSRLTHLEKTIHVTVSCSQTKVTLNVTSDVIIFDNIVGYYLDKAKSIIDQACNWWVEKISTGTIAVSEIASFRRLLEKSIVAGYKAGEPFLTIKVDFAPKGLLASVIKKTFGVNRSDLLPLNTTMTIFWSQSVGKSDELPFVEISENFGRYILKDDIC